VHVYVRGKMGGCVGGRGNGRFRSGWLAGKGLCVHSSCPPPAKLRSTTTLDHAACKEFRNLSLHRFTSNKIPNQREPKIPSPLQHVSRSFGCGLVCLKTLHPLNRGCRQPFLAYGKTAACISPSVTGSDSPSSRAPPPPNRYPNTPEDFLVSVPAASAASVEAAAAAVASSTGTPAASRAAASCFSKLRPWPAEPASARFNTCATSEGQRDDGRHSGFSGETQARHGRRAARTRRTPRRTAKMFGDRSV